MSILKLANAFIDLNESKVAGSKASLAMDKMVSYIQKKLGVKLIKIPGVEEFHNSKESGFGYRYVFSGTTKCVRFNWASEPKAGHTAEIKSIDIFTGKSSHPNFSVKTSGISLAQTLPALVTILNSPSISKIRVFPVSAAEAITESVVMEVARDTYSSEAAVKDFLKKLQAGKTFTRSEFIGSYHIVHAGIFDTVFKEFKDSFQIDAKRVSAKADSDISALQTEILSKAGVLEVEQGGGNETYGKTKAEDELNADPETKVPFSESLDHLKGLVQGVVAGAFNALFVAGKGGVGKTQTVENVLHANGLSDGAGYFKNTGSASAIGVYTLLYKYKDSIILFDDSDGALADQDARNLIKAATDTKKMRKIAWSKRSAGMFDPDEEGAAQLADNPDNVPKHFIYTGRIIFISNLSLDKLDPDKALRTRAFVINIDPTDDELFEFMHTILYDVSLEDGLVLSNKQRDSVFGIIKTSKKKNVSIRTLVRALNLAASGAPNWEKLVQLYA